jgi:hypothetical protein
MIEFSLLRACICVHYENENASSLRWKRIPGTFLHFFLHSLRSDRVHKYGRMYRRSKNGKEWSNSRC